MKRTLLTSMVLIAASANSAELLVEIMDAHGAAVPNLAWSISDRFRTVLQSGCTDGAGVVRTYVPGGSYILLISPSDGEQARHVVSTMDPRPHRIMIQPSVLKTEVTVTASASRVQETHEATQSTIVIGAEGLQRHAKAVLAQMALYHEGVGLQRTSGSLAGVTVRGHSGSKNSVSIDEVRFSNSAARGGVSTYFSVLDAGMIDSAEIVRGPASDRYGSDSLGGSVQLFSPEPNPERDFSIGDWSLYGNTADASFGSRLKTYFRLGSFHGVATQHFGRFNSLRPGGGKDSHAAVTRFLGLPSRVLDGPRLYGTSSTLYGSLVRGRLAVGRSAGLVLYHSRSQRDGGQRSDQLLGGDGNLRADLRNITTEMAYTRVQQSEWRGLRNLSATLSRAAQREERINQGEGGNPLAAIQHERERIVTTGMQAGATVVLPSTLVHAGWDRYGDRIAAPSWAWNPARSTATIRRGRIPDGAQYVSSGAFVHADTDLANGLVRLTGALRWNQFRYELSERAGLWPGDSYRRQAFAGRFGSALRLSRGFLLAASYLTGFRAPNVTDFGSLGLSGSGYEVGASALTNRAAFVGSDASVNAVPEQPVAELRPEKSRAIDVSLRYAGPRARVSVTGFISTVDDQVVKRTLLLPIGASGTLLGDDPIISQAPSGAVWTALSSNPVLVRANSDHVRMTGLEGRADVRLSSTTSIRAVFTSLRAHDVRTGAAPELEGGVPPAHGTIAYTYARGEGRLWIEPYVTAAVKQRRLSTLELQDRRIGASRSAESIARFFRNGATTRGLVQNGILLATRETLREVQTRVLGPALTPAPLYSAIPGYAVFGFRAGFRIARHHHLLFDLENAADRNYRGVSWGIDGPGRGLFIRYSIQF